MKKAINYTKTSVDITRENMDLRNHPVMRYLKNQELFKFKLGDILIKQCRKIAGPHNAEMWNTECLANGSPIKYLYAFENEFGIGYLKRLKADGKGVTNTLICIINGDYEWTRFMLDPEYADHLLIDDGDFTYNQQYLEKRAFRNKAIVKNKKLLIDSSITSLFKWMATLNIGDEFWQGSTYDDLITNHFKITDIISMPFNDLPSLTKETLNVSGNFQSLKHIKLMVTAVLNNPKIASFQVYIDDLQFRKISNVKPFPLKNPLCT